jgi:hypothetical protein
MTTPPAKGGTFETAYGLWVDSWKTALAAVATATQARTRGRGFGEPPRSTV